MKPGWKSSEFYVALAGLGGLTWTFIQSHCVVGIPELLAFAGVVISYIAGRTWLKSKQV